MFAIRHRGVVSSQPSGFFLFQESFLLSLCVAKEDYICCIYIDTPTKVLSLINGLLLRVLFLRGAQAMTSLSGKVEREGACVHAHRQSC